MEILIGFIGIVLTVAIALISYFKEKYKNRPKLEIELTSASGNSSSPRGLSPKNEVINGVVDGNDPIQIFELTWRVNLNIRNHSDIGAYYPKLYYSKDSITFSMLEALPSNPILNSNSVVLAGSYTKLEECRGSERTHVTGIPIDFKNLKMILEYKNNQGVDFFTVYNHESSDNKNSHLSRNPRR